MQSLIITMGTLASRTYNVLRNSKSLILMNIWHCRRAICVQYVYVLCFYTCLFVYQSCSNFKRHGDYEEEMYKII